MPAPTTDLLTEVAAYYSAKLAEHGPTPRGVDWNGAESQALRFEQLGRIIGTASHFTINDVGCGYGALLDFLAERHADFSYSGVDVSADMVRAARQRHQARASARFMHGAKPVEAADYGIASGILNVRLGRTDDEWARYLKGVLDVLDQTSTRGFAFNCLTSYSDPERMRTDLYYADPCALFDHCKRHYSPHVALLHDYGLYEFTILVRKQR
jgi:SAM-dependent methyltransferase